MPLSRYSRNCRGPLSPGASRRASLALPALVSLLVGGAIRSTDEKYTIGVATGTTNHSVTIRFTVARRGFGRTLLPSYNSGAGPDIFRLGLRLSVPSSTRKTLKGLQQYRGAADSDIYVLNIAKELVPLRGAPTRDSSVWYLVRRPRVEDTFVLTEWSHGQSPATSTGAPCHAITSPRCSVAPHGAETTSEPTSATLLDGYSLSATERAD